MHRLRLVRADEAPPPTHQAPGWRLGAWAAVVSLCLAVSGLLAAWWWAAGSEGRELRALPAAQRLPLFHHTVQNLRTICDPAAPRSLRDFCHRQAELALDFAECAAEPGCEELARRHLTQPRR